MGGQHPPATWQGDSPTSQHLQGQEAQRGRGRPLATWEPQLHSPTQPAGHHSTAEVDGEQKAGLSSPILSPGHAPPEAQVPEVSTLVPVLAALLTAGWGRSVRLNLPRGNFLGP